jgi:MFS family permease
MTEILETDSPVEAAAHVQAPDAPEATRFNGYATLMLSLVFMLANADRNILSVLLDPIKKSLHASDAAMGALGGLAFALVYATTAIPFARLADRGNRRNLIALALTFWSALTAVCGLASSYLLLLLARTGVAVGEAAHQPAIMSMIGDTFPRRSRGMATAWLTVGTATGLGIGAVIAGAMNDAYGWQSAFFVLGAPGLLVAALVFFTMREPARGAADGAGPVASTPEPFWQGMRQLASIRTIRWLVLANFFIAIAFTSWLQWLPAFFMRVHHMTGRQAGGGYGLGILVGATAASLVGGFLSDRLARRGERWRSVYCAVCAAIGIPAVVFTLITPSAALSVTGLVVYSIVTGGVTSVSMAAGLGVVRHSMRGLATAGMGFVLSVLGSIGPLAVGELNDLLNHTYGAMAVRYTLLSAVPGSLILAAIAFLFAARVTDVDAAAAIKP